MEVTSVSLAALQQAEEKVEQIARRLARPALAVEGGADFVHLSEMAVELLVALSTYKANLKALEAAQVIEQHSLDILG